MNDVWNSSFDTSPQSVLKRIFLQVVMVLCLSNGTVITHAQVPVSVTYAAVSSDSLFLAFGGSSWTVLHFRAHEGADEVDSPPYLATFESGFFPGERTPHTSQPPDDVLDELSRYEDVYNSGLFETAAAAAESLLHADSLNPFLLEALARALFRIPERRAESRDVYLRLMHVLDSQIGSATTAVPIDVHFLEAYGKLAALHLDEGDYQDAVLELSRALAAAFHTDDPAMLQFIDVQLGHLTEAYAKMEDVEAARWFGSMALQWNPFNQHVLPHMERLGPKPEPVVACMSVGESVAREGTYSLGLRRGDTRELECRSPTEDEDGTFVPCLRIGEIHVGMAQEDVYFRIGLPVQLLKSNTGDSAFVHYVFQNESTGDAAYYAIQYEQVDSQWLVSSVQLSGQTPPVALSCSCLQLGSVAEEVVRQLGGPGSVEEFRLGETGKKGEFWSYEPYTISFEVVDGVVYSMKVSRPANVAAQLRRPSLLYERPPT